MNWSPLHSARHRRTANRNRRSRPLLETLEQRLTLSAAPTPAGSVLTVNSPTMAEQQYNPSVAVAPDGSFVVVWQGDQFNGTPVPFQIFAQRYDAMGVAQGSPIQVNTILGHNDIAPRVAMDAAGDFVVTWEMRSVSPALGDIEAREFNAAGTPLTASEFTVNTSTDFEQEAPAVAMDPNGDFVIAWQSNQTPTIQIFAQRYEGMGVGVPASAQGGEFQVSPTAGVAQTNPTVAMDATGDFVVAWKSGSLPLAPGNIAAQRYNAAGVAVGGQFQVNSTTADGESLPAAAMDAAGDFAIAWQSASGSNTNIEAQRYNASGGTQGTEFQVNTATTNNEVSPAAAMDPAGDLVVSWQSNGISPNQIEAQAYDTTGSPLGSQFAVGPSFVDYQGNPMAATNQAVPAVALNAAGNLVFAWEGQYPTSIDQYANIYAQQFQVPQVPAASFDLAITKTDGTATYTPGGSTTYTIVVSNNGPSAVTGAAVNDALPAAITSASWSAVASAGASVATASGTGSIVNDLVSLVPGATVTFTLVALISPTATGNLTNTATVATTATAPAGVTDSNPANNSATDTDTPTPGTPVSAGQFATIGFWHNNNGQSVIMSFNGSSTSTLLGHWLATNFPDLFGASNPYISSTLASLPGSPTTLDGLTNAQIATVYANLWNPSGVTKNTYVQAFAVALGMYASTSSLGGASLVANGLAAKYGFKVTAAGGAGATFSIGSNTPAFPGLGSAPSVFQILLVVDSNFDPSTGLFYGGDQTKTSDANNVLNGINTQGDIS